MERVSDPEIRRRQILETAMRLFYEKGYEDTSMEDIAKELHIVKGLCYRYFVSKQSLFDTAMNEYIKECCQDLLEVIHDRNRSITDRLAAMLISVLHQTGNGRYHNFFHKPGNETIHEQLTFKMCKYIVPYVCEELSELCRQGKLMLEHPELTAKLIMYSQIGFWYGSDEPIEAIVLQFRKIVDALLNS